MCKVMKNPARFAVANGQTDVPLLYTCKTSHWLLVVKCQLCSGIFDGKCLVLWKISNQIVKIHFSRPGAIPRQGPAISANRIINLIHQQIHHLPHLKVQFKILDFQLSFNQISNSKVNILDSKFKYQFRISNYQPDSPTDTPPTSFENSISNFRLEISIFNFNYKF